MRILFRGLPPSADPEADENPGRVILQPGRRASAILAALAGVVLFLFSVAVTFTVIRWLVQLNVQGFGYKEFSLSAGIPVCIILTVLAHELAHALLHPGFGFTNSSVLFLDAKKLQFGVYYEGKIPRGRWIAMRLFPFVLLTAVPMILFPFFFFQAASVWDTYLIVMFLANSLGSGGDLAAVLIVLRQVPPGGVLNFHRGRAYWLHADRGADPAKDGGSTRPAGGA